MNHNGWMSGHNLGSRHGSFTGVDPHRQGGGGGSAMPVMQPWNGVGSFCGPLSRASSSLGTATATAPQRRLVAQHQQQQQEQQQMLDVHGVHPALDAVVMDVDTDTDTDTDGDAPTYELEEIGAWEVPPAAEEELEPPAPQRQHSFLSARPRTSQVTFHENLIQEPGRGGTTSTTTAPLQQQQQPAQEADAASEESFVGLPAQKRRYQQVKKRKNKQQKKNQQQTEVEPVSQPLLTAPPLPPREGQEIGTFPSAPGGAAAMEFRRINYFDNQQVALRRQMMRDAAQRRAVPPYLNPGYNSNNNANGSGGNYWHHQNPGGDDDDDGGALMDSDGDTSSLFSGLMFATMEGMPMFPQDLNQVEQRMRHEQRLSGREGEDYVASPAAVRRRAQRVKKQKQKQKQQEETRATAAEMAEQEVGEGVVEVPVDMRHDGDTGGGGDGDEELREGGVADIRRSSPRIFADQLLASLQRMVKERWRAPLEFILEVGIPIIFIAFSVVMAIAMRTYSFDAMQPIDYASGMRPLVLTPQPHLQVMCAQVGDAPGPGEKPRVPGLLPCDQVSFNATVSCEGNDEEIPVSGLCYDGTYTGAEIVLSYLMSSLGNMTYIPDFDAMVSYQWLAAKTMRGNTNIGMATLASAGFVANTAFNAITESGLLYLTPDIPSTHRLVDYLRRTTLTFDHVFAGVHESAAKARDVVAEASDGQKTWAILDVPSLTEDELDFTIQVNRSALPTLSFVVDPRFSGGFQDARVELYVGSGYLTLQKLVNDYYLREVLDPASGVVDPVKGPVVPYLAGMATQPYKQVQMIYGAGFIVAFLIALGWLYPVTALARRVVAEKELRLEEAMLIMGMGKLPRVISMLLFYVLQNFFTSLIIAMLLKVSYISQSDFYLMLVIFFLFSLSTISMGMFIASLFSKTRLASIMAPLIFFITTVPTFAMNNAPGYISAALSWLPPTCFATILKILFEHEVSGGLRMSQMWYALDSPKMGLLLLVLAGDTVFYLLLALYLTEVLPKDCGTPRHPLFFIIDPIRACCRACCDEGDGAAGGAADMEHLLSIPDHRDVDGVYEEEDPLAPVAVRMMGLRKQFHRSGRTFVAVDNLFLNLPDGGVSVLLGHNGAGKSTTLNMITGMTRPDGGDCFIFDKSVRSQLTAVRQEIGFCPQHNILWPELTCREHLEFFGKIKGLRGPALEEAVIMMLQEVDLLDKIDYKSKGLSGGMKRKLSVAMAFVGGSRLVFLDEPTAGMDAAARRHTWELLLRMSAYRSVLLTTHFMDEADLLGDRVAIMSKGRLMCSGSSLFLKSRLGVGYSISVSISAPAYQSVVGQLICESIPSAEVLEEKGMEVAYRLPAAEADDFPALLMRMEAAGEQAGIRGYALSATTLEEVFLKVAMADTHDQSDSQENSTAMLLDSNQRDELEMGMTLGAESTNGHSLNKDIAPPSSEDGSFNGSSCGSSNGDYGTVDVWSYEVVTGSAALSWMQFRHLMLKRLCNARRDRKMICFQVVCPVVCVLLAMLLNLIVFEDTTTMDFSDMKYPFPTELVVSNCDEMFGPEMLGVEPEIEQLHRPMRNAMDLNNYMQDTYYSHERDEGRYTAYQCQDAEFMGVLQSPGLGPLPVNQSDPVPAPFQPLIIFYNVSSMHEAAAGVQRAYSSIVRKAMPLHERLRHRLEVLPLSKSQAVIQNSITTMLIAIIIVIPFTFLPSNCVAWVVLEKECKSRVLQNIAGLRFFIYWVSNFVFDIVAHVVTVAITLIIFLCFRRKEYVGHDTWGATLVLFLIYGIAGITLAYSTHFLFKNSSAAQTILMVAGFATGFLCVMIVSVLGMVDFTEPASRYLRWPFRLLPTYCVGEGIMNLAMLEQQKVGNPSLTPFSLAVVGWPCLFMSAEIPLFILITLFFDHPALGIARERRAYNADGPMEHVEGEDTDVEDERREVVAEVDRYLQWRKSNGVAEEDVEEALELDSSAELDDDDEYPAEAEAVSVVHLRKVYPNGKAAVRDVTFTVVAGEVFGFLGTNGAGKTTTISILCQEFLPTSGRAFICGYDVVEERREALHCIGYCPQFDATLDLLTVEEHLKVFAGIHGIVSHQQQEVINNLLGLCDLVAYRDVLSLELSGGNRRKLSVAISLLGGPQVLFLDEPSAGMDPVARRGLWNSIQRFSDMCSIVLTTHHLEEVEALSDCVAIMVDGGLRCIGNKTHLKNKYGSGFEMNLRIESSDMKEAVETFIADHFPGAVQNEYRSRRFVYALPAHTPLSEVFRLLQMHKDYLGITDYSVSQTSIEQVFMRISEESEAMEKEKTK